MKNFRNYDPLLHCKTSYLIFNYHNTLGFLLGANSFIIL